MEKGNPTGLRKKSRTNEWPVCPANAHAEYNTLYFVLTRRPADVFRQLKGTPTVDEKTMLTIDLVETVNGLPLNLHILGCTLEELAHNSKIIAKETFKILNLKQ